MTPGSRPPTLAYLRSLVAALVLLGVLVICPGTALAGTRCHPELFAVSPSQFPTGSHVIWAGVETNQQLLRDDRHHFGIPPGGLGRLTGYSMTAVEGNPAVTPHPFTSYLVSIFRSPRLARMAYDVRWDTWFAANRKTRPQKSPIRAGDSGAEAFFYSLDPASPPYCELFFRRGAVLVEVFQGTATAVATPVQLHAFYTIALALDAVARRHPAGR